MNSETNLTTKVEITNRKMVDFAGMNIYAGLDVHKKNWNVTIRFGETYEKRFQQPPDPEILTNYFKRNFPNGNYIVAYEAGFCGFWIQRKFQDFGIQCLVINPNDVPTTDKENNSKNDPNDSRKIAKALSANMLKGIYIPGEQNERDRDLIRTRKKLQYDLIRVKNRIRGTLHRWGIKIPEKYSQSSWSKNFIDWLKKYKFDKLVERETMDLLIEEMLNNKFLVLKATRLVRKLSQTDQYKMKSELLLSVPGVGLLTSMKVLTEIIDIKRFRDFKDLNGYVGFYPTEHSTGENQKKGSMTERSNRSLRADLVEASWAAIRKDPALAISYERYKKHIGGKKAIVRIARKLLNRIKAILLTNKPYQINMVK